MQKLGWAAYSTGLLKMIPGIEFVPLPSQCCGIAGTYGFKKENYTRDPIPITIPKLVFDMPYWAVSPGMAIEKFLRTK